MAAHPGSVPDAGLGVHAAADPGLAGGAVLPALPVTVSDHRTTRRRDARRGAGELGGTGLLPARGQSAPAGAAGRDRTGRSAAGSAGGTAAAPRRGPLHRRRGGQLCLRAAGADGGHQRRPGIRRAFHPAPEARPNDRKLWATAGLRLQPRRGNAAWTFNQGIMELGAMVCTARVARCAECPVRGVCWTGKKGKGERM